MRLQVVSVGKPKLGFARAGVEEYLGRLQGAGGVTLAVVKAGTREQESAALLDRSEDSLRVVMDERGDQVTSRELAARLRQWEMGRVKSVSFLIGGADGHSPDLRQRADWQWSLSRLTLQHELALVVILEQLYRAKAILAGAPYHRD